jgi:hypothetical protein
MPQYKPRNCGNLPVDLINRTLNTELKPGSVRLSSQAHRHIAVDHPEDYAVVLQHLLAAISDPTYIGQSPKQRSNFEMVKRVAGSGAFVLIAIGLETDDYGEYRVRSAYTIKPEQVNERRSTQHLLVPKR